MRPSHRVCSSLLLLLLALGPNTAARADEDAVIKGAADFLVDRANANFVYIFQVNLKANEFFRTYFKNTYELVSRDDLRILLANTSLIHDALQDDLESFLAQSIRPTLEKLVAAVPTRDGVAKALDRIEERLKSADPEKAQVVRKRIGEIRKALAGLPGGCGPLVVPEDAAAMRALVVNIRCEILEVRQLLDTLRGAAEEQAWSAALVDSVRDALPGPEAEAFAKQWSKAEKRPTRRILDLALSLERIAPDYAKKTKRERKAAAAQPDAPRNRVQPVKRVLDFIELAGYVDEELRSRIEKNSDYEDFRRYALFFAQLTTLSEERSSPEEVKALLASVALPDVSFGVKRESNNYKWLITAYLGAGWAWQVRSHDPGATMGMIAPVGLEIAWGRRGWMVKCNYEDIVERKCQHSSLSLLFSPIDLGVPVAMRIAGNERSFKLSDVVAPGVYLVYGVKEYPLALGLGLVRGRSLQQADADEKRVVLFAGFDLPLFVLK